MQAAPSSHPPIIVSSLDYDRIEQLLESDLAHGLPGVDALEQELRRASVVEPRDMPAGVVTMNSTVRFEDVKTGSQHALTLVYPKGAGAPDTISVLAPAGSALLGLSVGLSIAWPMPGGRTLELRILEVISQPEAEGQFHR